MRRAPLPACLALALLLAACATLPPIPLDGRAFAPEPGERALWADAAREGDALLQRLRVYEDPALAAGLLALAGVPAGAAPADGVRPRVHIVRDPTLGALALPDGRLIVHTGLLAALERPEGLALLLAREMAHVTGRHAFRAARAGRVEAVRWTGEGPLPPAAAAVLGLQLPLASTAAITGYGRSLEEEADRTAVERLRRAGLDVAAAAAALDHLASRAAERGDPEVFRLARPAWLAERAAAVRGLTAGGPAPAAIALAAAPAGADLAPLLRAVARENAAEDIRLGRFALARRALDRVLEQAPDDAVAHVHYGDLLRLQAQRSGAPAARLALAEGARARYARAMALDPALAAPHRQLGLLHYGLGEIGSARAALERYLALAPGAPDAARIAEYVQELGR